MFFLSCNASAVIKLILNLNYNKNGKTITNNIEVSSDKIYKVSAIDNETGMRTYVGRIVSFTMTPEMDSLSFVNNNTKPSIVDTITVDYSDNRESRKVSLNVTDIRYVEEVSTSGFDEIVNREVPTFK
jgi:hypothetical protein